MKIKLTLISLLFASVSFADTITDSVKSMDSAEIYHAIVTPVNTIVNAVPEINPVVTAAKYLALLLGGFFTAKGIHFFKNRNEAKKNKG